MVRGGEGPRPLRPRDRAREPEPADPKTLNRAARDHLAERPAFALEAALLWIRWITERYGYEVTPADVLDAVDFALKAGEAVGEVEQVRGRIQRLVPASATRDPFFWSTILRRLVHG